MARSFFDLDMEPYDVPGFRPGTRTQDRCPALVAAVIRPEPAEEVLAWHRRRQDRKEFLDVSIGALVGLVGPMVNAQARKAIAKLTGELPPDAVDEQ